MFSPSLRLIVHVFKMQFSAQERVYIRHIHLPVRAPGQVRPGIRGHGIRIISKIIWSPQPGSSSNDFRERRSTIRKRDKSGANHPGPIAVSKPVWCLSGAGGGEPLFKLAGKKGDVSYFTFFFLSPTSKCFLPSLASFSVTLWKLQSAWRDGGMTALPTLAAVAFQQRDTPRVIAIIHSDTIKDFAAYLTSRWLSSPFERSGLNLRCVCHVKKVCVLYIIQRLQAAHICSFLWTPHTLL